MKATITLTSADGVSYFKADESRTIDDYDYETACAIFGQPLVDEHRRREWMAEARRRTGTATVTSIDRGNRVLTVGPKR